jgi:hypothetical protein
MKTRHPSLQASLSLALILALLLSALAVHPAYAECDPANEIDEFGISDGEYTRGRDGFDGEDGATPGAGRIGRRRWL